MFFHPTQALQQKISVTKNKHFDGESSSSSKVNKSSMSVMKGMIQSSCHGNGIPVSYNRRNHMVPIIRDNSVVSSSGRGSGNLGISGRLGAVASPATRRMLRPAAPTNPNPSHLCSPSNTYSRPNSSPSRLHSMIPGRSSEAELSHSLVNRNGFKSPQHEWNRRVLLALDRI